MEKTIVKCESMSTFASVVGNVTSFANEFFKKHFPEGYFKDIIINEELNSNIIGNKEIVKHSLPRMIIKPDLDLDDTFTEMLPKWYNDTHYIPSNNLKRQGAYTIFRDEEEKIYIHCIPTRIKINFECNIKVQTVMGMYNLVQHLRNAFPRETIEYINGVRLQTEIPKHMILALAKYHNIDLTDSGYRQAFVEYLNRNSMQGIEENINLATGNSMYAFNYIVSILSSYPDSPQTSKNVNNLVVEDCDVNFMFAFELWIPNKYLLEMPRYEGGNIEEVYEEDNSKFKYNIVLDVDYIKPKLDDKHLILKKSFLPDINVKYDELHFKPILSDGLLRALDFFKKENALTEDIFKVIVMCGNKILMDELYQVDYENFVIKTMYPMSNTTYTLLVYGNLEMLNEVSNSITRKTNTDYRNNPIAYGN